MNGGHELLLAVDLGGTKVAAAAVTSEGAILQRLEQPTSQAGPAALIEQIADMLRALMAERAGGSRAFTAIGVGIPAVLEPETDFVIWGPNLNGWRNVDLRGELGRTLGLPVYVEYDGHTAVLGEWWQGAARGYRDAAMIIVGTGIGGGLVLDGRLYRGRDRLAGAAGWFALTADAASADPRGQSLGHWESLAAGPGIARRAAALLQEYPASGLQGLPPDELTARRIFACARQNDELCLRVVAETARLIGLGVANVVSLVNPEIVVLGGSVGRQPELLPGIEQVVRQWAQPASAGSVKIVASALGAEAGLFGAAHAAWTRSQPAQSYTHSAGTAAAQSETKGVDRLT
jgi:glucokinase